MARINESFVNKLLRIIPNPRINCRRLGLGKIDATLMMNNPDIECRVEFTDSGRVIKEKSDPLIVRYLELSKQYSFAIKDAAQRDELFSAEILKNSQLRQNLRYKEIVENAKRELAVFGRAEEEIVDILIALLYQKRDSMHKMLLWICYGDVIYANLQRKIRPKTKCAQCVDCGEWFFVGMKDNRTCRCDACSLEHKRNLTRKRVQKHRLKSV